MLLIRIMDLLLIPYLLMIGCESSESDIRFPPGTYDLYYPPDDPSTPYFIPVNFTMPNLHNFKLCWWMFPQSLSPMTVFSYATKEYSDEIVIFFNKKGTQANMVIRDYTVSIPLWRSSLHRDAWYKYCFTWLSAEAAGILETGISTYKEEWAGIPKGVVISGGGTLVIGQDQEDEAEFFDVDFGMLGKISQIQLWADEYPQSATGKDFYVCDVPEGNILAWSKSDWAAMDHAAYLPTTVPC